MLKSVGNGVDMTVTVGPLYYGVGGSRAYFPTGVASQDVDLTSYIPSAGNRRRVLVYLDTSLTPGQLAVAAGAESPTAPEWPDVPYSGIPSAYFTLLDTHTAIDMTADYTDARRFLDGGGGSSGVVPTEAGQMLFANDQLEWEAGFLVMDPDTDEIVLDEDTGDLVWGN
jgi:hypothetical protein